MENNTRLKVSNIIKTFPGVNALSDISFEVKAGTVHALCGENGAGKSTLMKIISGIHQPDSGDIYIDNEKVQIKNPITARHLGVGMIAQELNFFPELTVEENLFVGRMPTNKFNSIDWKFLQKEASTILEDNGLSALKGKQLKFLSVSEIQQIEIAKALSLNAKILIMDEPTSSITESEIKPLFEKIKTLKAQGISIIYISHKLEEIFEIADYVTILRDGQLIATHKVNEITVENIVKLMVGRSLDNIYPKEKVAIGDKIFEVKNLGKEDMFKDVSFHVKKGEIVGFAGLVGSGRTEVMETIFGLEQYDSGEIYFSGNKLNTKTIRKNIEVGIGMVTEDRKKSGIVSCRSVMENATLSSLEKVFYKGKRHKDKEYQLVDKYFKKMDVKTPSFDTQIGNLSGGNQQKVILSKWLMRESELLILDEPTRGIDVGNKYEIYKLITAMAKENKAIILVSSELPELIGMCDRIYVMRQGLITGELTRDEFDQETIMNYATISLAG